MWSNTNSSQITTIFFTITCVDNFNIAMLLLVISHHNAHRRVSLFAKIAHKYVGDLFVMIVCGGYDMMVWNYDHINDHFHLCNVNIEQWSWLATKKLNEVTFCLCDWACFFMMPSAMNKGMFVCALRNQNKGSSYPPPPLFYRITKIETKKL